MGYADSGERRIVEHLLSQKLAGHLSHLLEKAGHCREEMQAQKGSRATGREKLGFKCVVFKRLLGKLIEKN